MYANESQGNKYPPLQIDYAQAYNEAIDGQQLSTKVGPEAALLYPEYMSDVSIGNCPEDDYSMDYIPETITYPVNNTPSENGHSWCTELEICGTDVPQFTRNSLTSFSYVYMPKLIKDEWIADPDDNATLAKKYALANTVLNCLDNITFDLTGVGQTSNAWNDNVTLAHLQEGVERFIITDVNTPNQSAFVQSQIPIMWDPIVVSAGGVSMTSNHIPGGSNILYLDGHVEFILFPAEHTQNTWPLSDVTLDKQNEYESW